MVKNTKTAFAKFEDDFPKEWMKFSVAGDAWLETLQLLIDNRDNSGSTIFYVEPSVIALALELFVKALVAHEDETFNAKGFSHATSKIINAYADRIPLLNTIKNDGELMSSIREYEKTMDVKYGEMSIRIGDDREKLIDTVFEIRAEMYKRTSVNYLRP